MASRRTIWALAWSFVGVTIVGGSFVAYLQDKTKPFYDVMFGWARTALLYRAPVWSFLAVGSGAAVLFYAREWWRARSAEDADPTANWDRGTETFDGVRYRYAAPPGGRVVEIKPFCDRCDLEIFPTSGMKRDGAGPMRQVATFACPDSACGNSAEFPGRDHGEVIRLARAKIEATLRRPPPTKSNGA